MKVDLHWEATPNPPVNSPFRSASHPKLTKTTNTPQSKVLDKSFMLIKINSKVNREEAKSVPQFQCQFCSALYNRGHFLFVCFVSMLGLWGILADSAFRRCTRNKRNCRTYFSSICQFYCLLARMREFFTVWKKTGAYKLLREWSSMIVFVGLCVFVRCSSSS